MMFWLLFIAFFVSSIESAVKACDDGKISFDGNLAKCATDPLYFLGEFNCAFFWHDNCGGRRLGICNENPDFSRQRFEYDASAVVVREGCVATACHGYNFTSGCATFGPGYHNFYFAKQLTSGDIDAGIPGPKRFNDRVKSAKCHCTPPTTTTTTTTTVTTTEKLVTKTTDKKKFFYDLDVLLIPRKLIKPTKITVPDY